MHFCSHLRTVWCYFDYYYYRERPPNTTDTLLYASKNIERETVAIILGEFSLSKMEIFFLCRFFFFHLLFEKLYWIRLPPQGILQFNPLRPESPSFPLNALCKVLPCNRYRPPLIIIVKSLSLFDSKLIFFQWKALHFPWSGDRYFALAAGTLWSSFPFSSAIWCSENP